MPNVNEKDILRRLEMLARIKPEAEATQQAMDKVRAQLLSGALQQTPAPPRILQLWHQPWARVAVAAVVAVVITLGGALWLRPNAPSGDPIAVTGTKVEIPVMPDDNVRLAAILAEEKQQIDQLFQVGDHRGLAAMLTRKIQPDSQALVASHLQDIGTLEDISALQKASDRWTGSPEENLFSRAINGIRERFPTGSTPDGDSETPMANPRMTSVISGFESEGVLSGIVTDESGKPVAGLDLEIAMVGGFIYQAVTDVNGFYSFDMVTDSGTYRLHTVSHTYLPPQEDAGSLTVALGPQSQVVKHLQLGKGCQVDVVVVDAAGRPIRDVRLIASWMGSDRANDVGQATRTDQDGRATMGAFSPSDIAYQLTAIHEDYALQRATFKCSGTDTKAFIQVELDRGDEVAGTVAYANGTPAQGIRIVAQPNWWHNKAPLLGAMVDRNGTFVLPGIVPGSYSILALVGGVSRQVTQVKLPLDDQKGLDLVLPGESPETKLAISGHLAFSEGTTPGALFVMAYSRTGNFVPRQPLNPEVSTFRLNGLPAGDYTLVFDGPKIRERIIENVPAPTTDLEVALEVVATPVIKGAVLGGQAGTPVENFRVGIMKKRNLPGLLITSEETWHTFADSGGRFEIPSEGPGLYQVQVVAEGYVPARLESMDTDDPHPAVFDLNVGGRIEGQVLTQTGQPIPRAKVSLAAAGRDPKGLPGGLRAYTAQYVNSDEQGRFVMDHVPEGTHQLKIEHPRYSTTWTPEILVWDSHLSGPLDVAMQEGARLEGYVYNVEGQAEANVTLLIQDGTTTDTGTQSTNSHVATVVTNELGFYQVDGLPANLCFVQRRDWDRVQGVVRQAVVPVAGETVRLDLGGRQTIRGTLVVDDQAITHHRLLIADAVRPHSPTFQCFGQTDGQGHFALSGIPLGHFGIYIQDLVKWDSWLKLGDFQMGTEDLDLGILPERLATIQVNLVSTRPSAAQGWSIDLVAGDPTWGEPVGMDFPVTHQGQQHVIDRVPPGPYTIVAQSLDGRRRLYQSLEVTTEDSVLETTLEVPVGSATFSVVLLEPMTPRPVLFSYDHGLMVTLNTQDAFFFVKDLPAGRYYIGNPYLRDRAPLTRFEIAEGEHKIGDINPRNWSSPGQGLLSVLVTDPQNIPIPAAQTWLEGPEGRIDPVVRTDREQMFVAPAGPYKLYATYGGFKARHKEVSIEANDVMALRPDRTLVQMRLEAP